MSLMELQLIWATFRYLGLKHIHEDKLNFVYYAGGRELIGDPGIYAYKINEFEPYWRGTWSHNSVVMDGLSQHRVLGPPENIPDPDRRFVMGDGFDFATGWYRCAYSPRTHHSGDESDKAAAIRDVQHQRIIFCVKGIFGGWRAPEYWWEAGLCKRRAFSCADNQPAVIDGSLVFVRLS